MTTNIGIIILNYLAYEETIHCTNGFLKQDLPDGVRIRIIIVDNNSPNDSYQILLEEFVGHPLVSVIRTNKNQGFAQGNNFGYMKLRSDMILDFLVISNEDIILESRNLYYWILTCYEKYQFSVLGPSVYSRKGDYFQNPVENYPVSVNECKIKLIQLKYQRKLVIDRGDSNNRQAYAIKTDGTSHEKLCFDKTLHGSFLVFSHQYFHEYQEPFNPKTFLYMEEDFLRLRCDLKNLVMVYDPTFKVIHLQAISTDAIRGQAKSKELIRLEYQIQSLKNYIQELRKNKELCLPQKRKEEENAFIKKRVELFAYIDRKDKIFIYGAGQKGNECLYLLKKRRKKVKGFIISDTEKGKGTNISCRYPICGLSEILPLPESIGIVVAVSRVYWEEVVSNLRNANIADYFIYCI